MWLIKETVNYEFDLTMWLIAIIIPLFLIIDITFLHISCREKNIKIITISILGNVVLAIAHCYIIWITNLEILTETTFVYVLTICTAFTSLGINVVAELIFSFQSTEQDET